MVVAAEQNKSGDTPLEQAKTLVDEFKQIMNDPAKLEPHLKRLETNLHMARIRDKMPLAEDVEAVLYILLAEKRISEIPALKNGMTTLMESLPEGERQELEPLNQIIAHKAGEIEVSRV